MATPNGESRNVLLCEDDPVQLRLFTALFEQAGYRSLPARSPSEALSVARRWNVDAVVTDVQLGDGTGFDLLGDLRQMGLDAPVIMATAYATEGMRARALRAGAEGFLEKPLDLRQIRRHVDRVVRDRGLHRPLALIVESLDGPRRAMEEAARRAGFAVLSANQGTLALDILRTSARPVDFLVTELHAPGISGKDLIERALRARPGLAVAVVTGEARREDLRAAYRAGATSAISKPFTAERLEVFFNRSLSASRAGQERAARRRERELRRAAAPWPVKVARLARRFRHGAVAVVATSSVLAGVVLAAALAWGHDALDRLEQTAQAAIPIARIAANSEDRSFQRWHLLEQLQMTRQANEAAQRYYDAHLREMRWSKAAPTPSPFFGHEGTLSADGTSSLRQPAPFSR